MQGTKAVADKSILSLCSCSPYDMTKGFANKIILSLCLFFDIKEFISNKSFFPCQDDEFTHLYTLIVKPDNTYEVKIDNAKVCCLSAVFFLLFTFLVFYDPFFFFYNLFRASLIYDSDVK